MQFSFVYFIIKNILKAKQLSFSFLFGPKQRKANQIKSCPFANKAKQMTFSLSQAKTKKSKLN